jgi:GDSL-like Lipase/Acylhydrolase family
MLRRAVCGTAIAVFVIPAAARADWKSAPIVPKLDAATSKQTLATLRRGRALGNRPDVLAKVGDSITQSPAFLDPLGCGQSRLGRYRGLRATVRLFAARSLPGRSQECRTVNSFSRDSAAALLRTTSWWPLDPTGAEDPACRVRESPLVCEIRLDRPAFAVILTGTNDISVGVGLGGDPIPDFLTNMRAIVRASRQLAVVPILNTLPPRTDSAQFEAATESLNEQLVDLAHELHTPLINLWRALAPLPGQGLWDGLHPSVSGWPGCSQPCNPSRCAPKCFAANFTPAGLAYGTDTRNLITLLTLRRLSALAPPRRR